MCSFILLPSSTPAWRRRHCSIGPAGRDVSLPHACHPSSSKHRVRDFVHCPAGVA
jgi:hypothetical protein